MKLSERSYPHPVLGNRDDVPEFGFQAAVTASSDKENFYIEVEVQCGSDALRELVKEKKAAYVLHLECSNTLYRWVWRFHEDRHRVIVPAARLSDKFEVNVFVCAMSAISSYSIPGAHTDYSGVLFDLREGDIMAVGEGKEFPVETEDVLARIGSIMVIRQSETDEEGVMRVDYDDQKIGIILSKKDFVAYKLIRDHEPLAGTLTSTIVLPVLVHALGLMQAGGGEDYSEWRWHRTLKSRLEKMGVNQEYDALEVAQQILERPIKRALASASAYVHAEEA